jgi:4-amino-4-deoxy-L-arabinose transferase-like glycosyltransferase
MAVVQFFDRFRSRRGPGGPGPTVFEVGAVILSVGLVALLVGIRGDFPLSDDWSAAWTARHLCEDGELAFLPWSAASMVLHVGLGALACALFGFSFTVLRVVTLSWAVLALLGTYRLARLAGCDRPRAWLATGVLAVSPLFVNLSFTFMTDVPFVALVIWAAVLYLRGLEQKSRSWMLAGAVICAASILVRQNGIFVCAAATLAALVATRTAGENAERFELRERGLLAAVAGVVPVVAFVGWHAWLFVARGAPAGVSRRLLELGELSPLVLADAGFRALATLGFLLLPLAPVMRLPVTRAGRRIGAAATGLLAAGAVAAWWRDGSMMFYLPNVMYDLGVGPLTLRDTLFLGMDSPVHLGAALAIPLTLASLLSLGLFAGFISDDSKLVRTPGRFFLSLLLVSMFTGSLLQAGLYLDRYLLPLLPFAAVLALSAGRLRAGAVTAGVLLALMASYSVMATHDYMAWNRARWTALSQLEEAGHRPADVDGGFEYNGWYLAAEEGTWPTMQQARRGQDAAKKSWWWVLDDRFVLSFQPLDGYGLHSVVQYPRWLPPGRGAVHVLEQVAGK